MYALLALFFSLQSFAEPLVMGPIAGAMGGSGVAAVDASEAGFLNPAAIAHLRTYYGTAFTDFGELRTGGYQTTYGVLLADGSSDKVMAGSIGYFYRKSTGDLIEQDIQMNLAEFSFGGIAFGVAAHRYMYKSPTLGSGHQHNADAGMIWSPTEYLGMGLSLTDIWPNAEDIPHELRPVPTYNIGIHYLYTEQFRVRSDVSLPDKNNPGRRINFGMGVESFIHEFVAVRFGHRWIETEDAAVWTAGFGYHGPKLSLDYALERDWRNQLVMQRIDLWMPL